PAMSDRAGGPQADRPSQAQRPAMSNRAGGPQADRPSQAQRRAMSDRAGGPQADRPPQAQRPAMSNRGGGPPTERPMMNQQPRPYPGAGRAGSDAAPRAALVYSQVRAPAQLWWAPAQHVPVRHR